MERKEDEGVKFSVKEWHKEGKVSGGQGILRGSWKSKSRDREGRIKISSSLSTTLLGAEHRMEQEIMLKLRNRNNDEGPATANTHEHS